MYQVLTKNGCKIPKQGLDMVRYHSFYPWHSGGDYYHLCSEEDFKSLEWVQKFKYVELQLKAFAVTLTYHALLLQYTVDWGNV